MTAGLERLEHLFSREIDGEITPAEREVLRTVLRVDPEARARFEAYRELDRMVGDALRAQAGRRPRVLRAWWGRGGRGVLVAAAACVAMLVWYPGPRTTERPSGRAGQPVQGAAMSWFGPQTPVHDAVEPVPASYERPELKLRGTQRDWIVIPGDQAGEYLVIEVDRVRTHRIKVQRDF